VSGEYLTVGDFTPLINFNAAADAALVFFVVMDPIARALQRASLNPSEQLKMISLGPSTWELYSQPIA